MENRRGTGITGQKGLYLAELLLDAGRKMHGVARRSSTLGYLHLDPHEKPQLCLQYGDLALRKCGC